MRFGRSGSVVFVQWPGQKRRETGLLGLAVRFVINVAALWLAQILVRGFDIGGLAALVFGAAIFGTVNTFIKPLISFLSCALTCLTLGLFTLIINAAMLGLTAWIAGLFDLSFQVDGFLAALLGALVISVASTVLSMWADEAILRRPRPHPSDDW